VARDEGRVVGAPDKGRGTGDQGPGTGDRATGALRRASGYSFASGDIASAPNGNEARNVNHAPPQARASRRRSAELQLGMRGAVSRHCRYCQAGAWRSGAGPPTNSRRRFDPDQGRDYRFASDGMPGARAKWQPSARTASTRMSDTLTPRRHPTFCAPATHPRTPATYGAEGQRPKHPRYSAPIPRPFF
jgi:hypothetical protein